MTRRYKAFRVAVTIFAGGFVVMNLWQAIFQSKSHLFIINQPLYTIYKGKPASSLIDAFREEPSELEELATDNGVVVSKDRLQSKQKQLEQGLAFQKDSYNNNKHKIGLDLPRHVSVSKLLEEAAKNVSLVVQWEGVWKINRVVDAYWKRNVFCDEMNARIVESTSSKPTIVNISFNCQEVFERGTVGTGNFMSLFYAIRLAARAFKNINVAIQCNDAEQEKKYLILPWLMGYFLESSSISNGPPTPALNASCAPYLHNPTGYMIQEMQHDLRRMAIALVGIPYKGHSSEAFAKKNLWYSTSSSINSGVSKMHRRHMQLPNPLPDDKPLYPNVTIDDAIIHFRCGDFMSSNHPSFAFLKFNDYARHLKIAVRSIGIVTQPFGKEGGQERKEDIGNDEKCRIVVYALVDYLQERFPDARISVYNDANESIALTFARMIMANQSVAGISSFGVFGPLASFGEGYVRYPDYRKAPNRWLTDFVENPDLKPYSNGITLYRAPKRLPLGEVEKMWQLDKSGQSIVEWMRNETL